MNTSKFTESRFGKFVPDAAAGPNAIGTNLPKQEHRPATQQLTPSSGRTGEIVINQAQNTIANKQTFVYNIESHKAARQAALPLDPWTDSTKSST